jgi:5'-nucleotidase
MLVSVSSTFTVTNTNNTNRYGEVGLAAGAGVLRQPTDVARPGPPRPKPSRPTTGPRRRPRRRRSPDYAARANKGAVRS